MLQTSTIKFLEDLKKNNSRDWFEKSRSRYEAAKADFAALVQCIIDKHGKKDASIAGLTAKECMFRINRDVRFSKDKSPYKTNFGASINRGGKKSFFAGYYLHCEPGESFTGGGIWMPVPEHLKKIRQEIDYNFPAFQQIINSKKFKEFYGNLYTDKDSVLSRPPKGYDEANPAIAFLKLKSFLAMKKLTDAELTGKKLEETIIKSVEILEPLLDFINKPLE